MSDWTQEFLAASRVADLARDPDDFRVTRQSKVAMGGLLVPVSEEDRHHLGRLFDAYATAFSHYQGRYTYRKGGPPFTLLSATMQALLQRAARRRGVPGGQCLGFDYISIDPRDYTIFTAPHIDVPVVCIHTRPERCWFLGIMRFEGALGLSLGRMRVMKPTDQGVYPVTIRTKWRALTNKVKQEEVRDAYQRLLQSSR